MPPKTKFTREEVVAAALNLVRREGLAAVTARALGAQLGVSSRPIFTVFRNMEEVQQETVQAARALYNRYTEEGLAQTPAFKGVGMQYFRFAKEEPRLFELLFMRSSGPAYALADILDAIDDNSGRILASVQGAYGVSAAFAQRLYQRLWVFTHGLACLCATGISQMPEEETGALLTEIFSAIFTQMKREGNEDA